MNKKKSFFLRSTCKDEDGDSFLEALKADSKNKSISGEKSISTEEKKEVDNEPLFDKKKEISKEEKPSEKTFLSLAEAKYIESENVLTVTSNELSHFGYESPDSLDSIDEESSEGSVWKPKIFY
eukprot:gene8275-100_t